MNKKQKIVCIVAAVLVVFIGIFVIGNYFSNQNAKKDQKEETLDINDIETEHDVVVNGKKYKYNNDIKTVLFIGTDNRDLIKTEQYSGRGGQSDCLILYVMNKETKKVKVLEISRNTMVDLQIYDMDGEEIGREKGQIALQYSYGDGVQRSSRLTQNAVSELLYGTQIDSYLTMSIDGIGKATELIGGVPIQVPEDYTDIHPSFQKGANVTLSGAEAELYVRKRDVSVSGSNQGRMRRQTQFMEALIKKLNSTAGVDASWIQNKLDELQDYLVTDMTVDEIKSLSTYEVEEIIILPGEEVAGEVYDEFYVDDEALYQLVVELFYKPVEE